MSDTSLVFNLLGRDNVSKVLGVIRGAFTSAGKTAETSMDKATVSTERLDQQIQETERHLAELNREFSETGDKTLFGKMARDRSLLTQLRRVRGELQATNQEAAKPTSSGWVDQFRDGASAVGRAASMIGGFGATAAGVIGPVGALVAALGAATAGFAALGPAVAVAGGAIGSLPGILAGGIAAAGSLKLGLFGLGDEYRRLTTATGGSSSAAKAAAAADRQVEQAARAVARAERDVRDAQKDALTAQKAINDARKAAAGRMRDQALDLEGAQMDQKDAAKALAEAQAELDAAKDFGDPRRIEAAQDAYDRAALAVKQSKARVDDLTEATQKNAKAGVEGSDEVVAAKEREADARRRVKDAQEAEAEAERRLADARKESASGGGGGGGGQQITKLAPAAREFLNTIIGLRPAFEALRLDVQQRLFAGLAERVQTLAERWMPQLKTSLGGFASTFNGIAKTFLGATSRKSFIENMGAGAESARKALREVGTAVGGPLVDAFGRLARASGPFVEKLGSLIGRAVEKFSEWIRKADESGALTEFFRGAASTLEKIWVLAGRVVEVGGKVLAIFYPDAKASGDSALDSINTALAKVSVWLDDPDNQQKIKDFIDGFLSFGRTVWDVGVTVFTVGVKIGQAFQGIRNAVSAVYTKTVEKGGQIVGFVAGLPERIAIASRGMWDGIKNSFRSAINWIIGKWNNLSFPVPGILGGGSIGMPPIDYLAQGGIVPATPGGRLAVIGEGGQDEAVIPLPKFEQMRRAGGREEIEVRVKLDFGDSEIGRMMARAVRTQPAVSAAIRKSLKVTVTA